MPTDFTLPELGENITDGDVVRVLVKPGDVIAKEQSVLEIDTDKATIEVPSSVAGRVTDVKVKAGDKVKVGQALLSVEEGAAAGDKLAAKATEGDAPAKDKAAAEANNEARAAAANTGAKVTGDGGLEPHAETAPPAAASDKPGAPERAADSRGGGESQGGGARPRKVVDISRGSRATAEPAAPDLPPAPAAPSVRRMARELGVDVNEVSSSGPDGRISPEDVKAHARRLLENARRQGGGATREVQLPDFTRWGGVERQPMRAVRRKTAEHLALAWATIPHVTQHDRADITALDAFRKHYAKQAEASGGTLTVTAIAVKVAATALKMFPRFNASIDMAAQEIILKQYVNIGVAVDTDRGLLVPVIRGADTKNILQIAAELAQLAEKARTRKIALEEMQGGSFSISNLGGIGGTSFTPIINAPEVAILGISRARMEPVWNEGAFTPRLTLPLSLSYDHRAIDGADGARFLRWIAEALEQPFLLALQG